MKVKAISMKQPWAECVFRAGKNVENRTWNTKFRGWIGIHASNAKSKSEFELCKHVSGTEMKPDELVYGSLLGFAKITRVIKSTEVTDDTKKWFQGDYGFVLNEFIPLKTPVKMKGSLGIWDVQESSLKECLEQLSEKDRHRLDELELGSAAPHTSATH